MSDRFVFDATKKLIEQQFGIHSDREDYFESDYNISPGARIPIIINDSEGQRQIRQALWGLLPPDADADRAGAEHYERAAGEIGDNSCVAEGLEIRRCLMPAQGFYKWKTTNKKSTPFYIRLLANEPMGIAGVYGIWESPSGRKVYSCTMLTTEANVLVQPVGDAMPVIIDQEDYEEWLQREKLTEEARDRLIRTYPMGKMAVNRVSEKVNDVDNNGPELIQPIPK